MGCSISNIKTRLWNIANKKSNIIQVESSSIIPINISTKNDIQSKKNNNIVLKGDSWIHSMAISDNGRFVASGTQRGIVRVWDTKYILEIMKIEGYNTSLGNVGMKTISLSKHLVVFRTDDNAIKIWDVKNNKEIATWDGHSSYVGVLSISLDEKIIVIGLSDGIIKIWDIQKAKEISILKGHDDYISSIAISLNGKIIISSSKETIKVWDIQNAIEISSIKNNLGAYYGSFEMTVDDKILAAGLTDGTIELWDMQINKKHINTYDVPLVFSPNNKILIMRGTEVWDIEKNEKIAALENIGTNMFNILVSQDYKTIMINVLDRDIRVLDIETNIEIMTLKNEGTNAVFLEPTNKNRIAVVSGEMHNVIKVWDIKNSEIVAILNGHDDYIACIVTSLDGKKIISSSKNQIKIWDIDSTKEIGTLEGHNSDIVSIIISADGKKIISNSKDQIKIWDIDSTKEIGTLEGHNSDIVSIAISADGKKIISSSKESLKIWDIESIKEIDGLIYQYKDINNIVISSSGKFVAISFEFNTIKILDITKLERYDNSDYRKKKIKYYEQQLQSKLEGITLIPHNIPFDDI